MMLYITWLIVLVCQSFFLRQITYINFSFYSQSRRPRQESPPSQETRQESRTKEGPRQEGYQEGRCQEARQEGCTKEVPRQESRRPSCPKGMSISQFLIEMNDNNTTTTTNNNLVMIINLKHPILFSSLFSVKTICSFKTPLNKQSLLFACLMPWLACFIQNLILFSWCKNSSTSDWEFVN